MYIIERLLNYTIVQSNFGSPQSNDFYSTILSRAAKVGEIMDSGRENLFVDGKTMKEKEGKKKNEEKKKEEKKKYRKYLFLSSCVIFRTCSACNIPYESVNNSVLKNLFKAYFNGFLFTFSLIIYSLSKRYCKNNSP